MLDSVTIHTMIQELYFPKDVVNISDMSSDTYQYLIALNNKGYNAHTIKISQNASMQTLDKAIRYKDLNYLEIEIKENKISYSFWKYPKGTNGRVLKTSIKPFKKRHEKYLEKLQELRIKLKRRSL